MKSKKYFEFESHTIDKFQFQLKKTLRQCQRDQERGTADHGVMVRELQTLLTTERNKSETLEQQVDQF